MAAKDDGKTDSKKKLQIVRKNVVIAPKSKVALWMYDFMSDVKRSLEAISSEFYRKIPGKPLSEETKCFENVHPTGRNRYRNVPCLDCTRVKLRQIRDNLDYIHANVVTMPQLKRRYILTQAPLPQTEVDFWELIWQENVCAIVCLTKLVENNQTKTQEYWPNQTGKAYSKSYGDLQIVSLSTKSTNMCCLSMLQISRANTSEVRKLVHYLYLNWPDHRVPTCCHEFLQIVDFLDSLPKQSAKNSMDTVLVHCSAGIGRSGTLVALKASLNMICNDEVPTVVDIVISLRKQRALAIQGPEQYLFIYHAILVFIIQHIAVNDAEREQLLERAEPFRLCSTRSECEAHPRRKSFENAGGADRTPAKNAAEASKEPKTFRDDPSRDAPKTVGKDSVPTKTSTTGNHYPSPPTTLPASLQAKFEKISKLVAAVGQQKKYNTRKLPSPKTAKLLIDRDNLKKHSKN